MGTVQVLRAAPTDTGWETVLAAAATGLVVIDDAGRIRAANAEARALISDALRLPVEVELRETAQPQRAVLQGGRSVDVVLRPLPDGWMATVHDADHAGDAAHVDPLTGLANRVAFGAHLAESLGRLRRGDEALAVLYVDLDRFKLVNDTLGHPVGDALLRQVADRLRAACRSSDVVARLGGDEFAIIQAASGQPQAAQSLSRRLIALVSRPYEVDGHTLNVGASVGVALAPVDGDDPATLLKNADLALYRAKADGRGCARFFEPEMDRRMQARRTLEVDLRRALLKREFELVYQPQVSLPARDLVGFEALIRWRHPERGVVSPNEFIPLVEEIGLMDAVGEWVLRTATAAAASWSKPVWVAVNLSPRQFRTGRLAGTITSALAASGLAPQRLELEITESTLLEDSESVLGVLNAVRALGVRVSMDDFGTGYSSLSHLQRFPFDKIKIDQSFVRTMVADADSRAIVRAVATLGASLGMRTTAEGVETAEELACVGAEGCTDVQGYLTGRPLSAEDAAALLAADDVAPT